MENLCCNLLNIFEADFSLSIMTKISLSLSVSELEDLLLSLQELKVHLCDVESLEDVQLLMELLLQRDFQQAFRMHRSIALGTRRLCPPHPLTAHARHLRDEVRPDHGHQTWSVPEPSDPIRSLNKCEQRLLKCLISKWVELACAAVLLSQSLTVRFVIWWWARSYRPDKDSIFT